MYFYEKTPLGSSDNDTKWTSVSENLLFLPWDCLATKITVIWDDFSFLSSFLLSNSQKLDVNEVELNWLWTLQQIQWQ